MDEAAPRLGQTVHYMAHGTPPRPDGFQTYPGTCRAAVVTEVGPAGAVALCVLNPTGMFFNPDVGRDDGRTPAGISAEGYPCVAGTGGRIHAGGTWHPAEPAAPEGDDDALTYELGDSGAAAERVHHATVYNGGAEIARHTLESEDHAEVWAHGLMQGYRLGRAAGGVR